MTSSLTNAEKQQIYAQAWRDGRMDTEAWGGMDELIQRAKNRALRRYPDPKVYKLSDLGECRYVDGKIEVRSLGSSNFSPCSRNARDYLVFAQAIKDAEIAQEAQQEKDRG